MENRSLANNGDCFLLAGLHYALAYIITHSTAKAALIETIPLPERD
ncbi:hypothetical protein AALB16_04985 [Lachnospiraceae bacterium 62-35]